MSCSLKNPASQRKTRLLGSFQHPQTWWGAGRKAGAQAKVNSSDGQRGVGRHCPWQPGVGVGVPGQAPGLGSALPNTVRRGQRVVRGVPAGVTTTAWAGVRDVRLAGKRARWAAFYGADLVQSGQVFTGWAAHAQITGQSLKFQPQKPSACFSSEKAVCTHSRPSQQQCNNIAPLMI